MPGFARLDQCSSRVPFRWGAVAGVPRLVGGVVGGLFAGLLGGLLPGGCSSAGEDTAALSGLADGGGYDPANGGSWGGDSEEGDGDSSGGADDGSDDDPTDGADTGSSEPPPRGDDDGTFARCPAPLPGAWVFCEDFETLTDPGDVMLDYQDRDGAFVLVDGIGASGDRAMEAS